MDVVMQRPPVWDRIVEHIGEPPATALFTYGSTIYSPSGHPVPPDLVVHEQVHERQQAGEPDKWWATYLVSPEFRVMQEVEAYRAQYRFVCQQERDRNARARVLFGIASALSGRMYGNIISQADAIKAIKA